MAGPEREPSRFVSRDREVTFDGVFSRCRKATTKKRKTSDEAHLDPGAAVRRARGGVSPLGWDGRPLDSHRATCARWTSLPRARPEVRARTPATRRRFEPTAAAAHENRARCL